MAKMNAKQRNQAFEPAKEYLKSFHNETILAMAQASGDHGKTGPRINPATGLFEPQDQLGAMDLAGYESRRKKDCKAPVKRACVSLLTEWAQGRPELEQIQEDNLQRGIEQTANHHADMIGRSMPQKTETSDSITAIAELICARNAGSKKNGLKLTQYNAIAGAIGALEYLAQNLPAAAIWHGNAIAGRLNGPLPNDAGQLAGTAFRESELTQNEWDFLNTGVSPDKMRADCAKYGRSAATAAWAALRGVPGAPDHEALKIAGHQTAKLLRENPGMATLPERGRRALTAFYRHWRDEKEGTNENNHHRITSIRKQSRRSQANEDLAQVLKTATSNGPGPEPQPDGDDWMSWREAAKLPPPKEPSNAGHADTLPPCEEMRHVPPLENPESLLPPIPVPEPPKQDSQGPGRSRDHCTQSTLKARGWTAKLISDLLGEPDKTAPNPHYNKGALMRLYDWERVERAENEEEFGRMAAKAEARRVAGRKAAQTRRRKAAQWAANVEIRIYCPTRSLKELRAVATEHAKDYAELRAERRRDYDYEEYDRSDYGGWSGDEPTGRWCVNFLRHECSEYDMTLADTFGQTGKELAISIIRLRIYRDIARHWPSLRYECERKIEYLELEIPNDELLTEPVPEEQPATTGEGVAASFQEAQADCASTLKRPDDAVG